MPILFYSLLPEIRKEANSPLAKETLREKGTPHLSELPAPERQGSGQGLGSGSGAISHDGKVSDPWTWISFLPYGDVQLQRRSETEAESGLGSTQRRVKGYRDKCPPTAFDGV